MSHYFHYIRMFFPQTFTFLLRILGFNFLIIFLLNGCIIKESIPREELEVKPNDPSMGGNTSSFGDMSMFTNPDQDRDRDGFTLSLIHI